MAKKNKDMKALQFEKTGKLEEVLQLTETPMPSISPTQVLVQVKARPVNPADQLFVKGVYRKRPVLPQIAGLEGSGTIVECGSAVSGFAPGDHVAFRAAGTWAGYCAVEQEALIPIHRNIHFTTSCQVALNPITAIALLQEARLKAGDRLLLNAASSSLAGIIIQMALHKGIQVVGLVHHAQHIPALQALGAQALLQDDAALAEQLQTITGGKGFNAFLDAVGGPVLTTVIPLMAPYGYISVYGNLSNNAPAAFTNSAIIYKNLTLQGFGIDHWLSGQTKEQIQQAYRTVVNSLYDGTLTFRPTVAVPLEKFITDYPALPHNAKPIIV
jgi:NADPH:quinone reductase-like Zn-dependent oxidoreductase